MRLFFPYRAVLKNFERVSVSMPAIDCRRGDMRDAPGTMGDFPKSMLCRCLSISLSFPRLWCRLCLILEGLYLTPVHVHREREEYAHNIIQYSRS